jgi:hypothetical protein
MRHARIIIPVGIVLCVLSVAALIVGSVGAGIYVPGKSVMQCGVVSKTLKEKEAEEKYRETSCTVQSSEIALYTCSDESCTYLFT